MRKAEALPGKHDCPQVMALDDEHALDGFVAAAQGLFARARPRKRCVALEPR
jgi:hypothetical protein